MIEDSALSLKKAYDNGEMPTKKEVQNLLEQSEVLSKFLVTQQRSPNTFAGLRGYMWRLLELSEIPFTNTLEKVQEWIELLVNKSYIDEGFALEGKMDNLLACHNAMITTILLKMEYDDKEKIDSGINWILEYQAVERGKECKWPGSDLFTRFGGCMKSIPCYYGVIKSMNALTEYKKSYGGSTKLTNLLNQGLEYILCHRVFKKLSANKPIEDSIILNFYPYTYKSNVIEILTLLKANGLMKDERCSDALELLKKKQRSDGHWQADTSYMKSAWIDFDEPQRPGFWISYVIDKLILN